MQKCMIFANNEFVCYIPPDKRFLKKQTVLNFKPLSRLYITTW